MALSEPLCPIEGVPSDARRAAGAVLGFWGLESGPDTTAQGRRDTPEAGMNSTSFHLANRDSETTQHTETPLSLRNHAHRPFSENGGAKPHRNLPPNREPLFGNPLESKIFFMGTISIGEQAQ